MSRTVTLRLDEKNYDLFKVYAERDHRTLSNFIETSALRFIESELFCDDSEMAEIKADAELNKSLQEGHEDFLAGRGSFVE
jgi:hypothetical protein